MRRAIRINIDNILDLTDGAIGGNVMFYVDQDYRNDLNKLLGKKGVRKKFFYILNLIDRGQITEELYRNEEVSKKAKDVRAMKIKTKFHSYRIYCKEFFVSSNKKVVAITHISKDTEGMRKKTKDLLERIGGYDYEFED